MRKFKEIQIENKKITIFELTVKDIKKLWRDITGASPETENMPMFSNETIMNEHWDKCIHGLKIEETDDMAPSELQLIYDAFAEVNAVFFDLALKIEGENLFLKSLRATIITNLMLRFATLSNTVTEGSGDTDTVSS